VTSRLAGRLSGNDDAGGPFALRRFELGPMVVRAHARAFRIVCSDDADRAIDAHFVVPAPAP
jgi:hypothetical protein